MDQANSDNNVLWSETFRWDISQIKKKGRPDDSYLRRMREFDEAWLPWNDPYQPPSKKKPFWKIKSSWLFRIMRFFINRKKEQGHED